jgi:hypothetical protein
MGKKAVYHYIEIKLTLGLHVKLSCKYKKNDKTLSYQCDGCITHITKSNKIT